MGISCQGLVHSCAAYSNLAVRPSSLLEAAVGAKNARGQTVQGDILDADVAGVQSTSVIEAARAAMRSLAETLLMASSGNTAFALAMRARPSMCFSFRGHLWVHLRYGTVAR